jgi:peroxiredoxin (alkyl hydroperoxide reductase subunit C)
MRTGKVWLVVLVSLGLLAVTLQAAMAQYDAPVRMPLIGEKAPSFTASTSEGPIKFPDDYAGKWVVMFSHPGDFTPVCTTEFMMFAKMTPDFKARNCELIGLSVDGLYSHIAWLRMITDKGEYQDIKHPVVTFPVIADTRGEIAAKYGMLQPSASTTQTVRAVFFIDPQATIRAILYYPLTTGRNVDEIVRMLTAMQVTDQFKVSTPANWMPGEEVIVPPPGSCGTANQRVATANEQGLRCVDWFLCFKPSPLKAGELPNGLGPNPPPK